MTSAFLALGLNSDAYQAEYLRGSILAIGEGQNRPGAKWLERWARIPGMELESKKA